MCGSGFFKIYVQQDMIGVKHPLSSSVAPSKIIQIYKAYHLTDDLLDENFSHSSVVVKFIN